MKLKAVIKKKKFIEKKNKTDLILIHLLNLKLDESGKYTSKENTGKSNNDIKFKNQENLNINSHLNIITNINNNIKNKENPQINKKEDSTFENLKIKNNNKIGKILEWEQKFIDAFNDYSDISISEFLEEEIYNNNEIKQLDNKEEILESNKFANKDSINNTEIKNININRNINKKYLDITKEITKDNKDNLIYNELK